MYNYEDSGGLGSTNSLISSNTSALAGAGIWWIIALILALVGCFLVYFLFVAKKENPKQKFLGWLKEFLSFDKMLIVSIVKLTYYFFAIYITLVSFAFISVNFLLFLAVLIIGNLIARIVAEGILIRIMIWKNTTEIKKHLK